MFSEIKTELSEIEYLESFFQGTVMISCLFSCIPAHKKVGIRICGLKSAKEISPRACIYNQYSEFTIF